MELVLKRAFMITAMAAIVVMTLCICVACSKSSSPAKQSQTLVQIAQPSLPTAHTIAADLNCTKFHDNGPDQVGLSVDTGVCWIGATKYGVNTFKTSNSRNTWVKMAESLGANPPKFETATSVVYVASDQTSDNG
jgi:hypothetical protein